MKSYKILHGLATVLAILFVLFLMMFSLDVLESGGSAGEIALGMLMHNIPALILLAIVLISLKFDLVGGIVFLLAGLGYAVFGTFRADPWYRALVWSLSLAAPAIAVGVLYLISWQIRRKNNRRRA